MFFGNKKNKKRVICNASVILSAMEETIRLEEFIISLIILYKDEKHKVGISSDYNQQRGFFDQLFYLDEQEFDTLNKFKLEAILNDKLFVNINDGIEVLKADDGAPANFTIFADYIV